MTGGTVRRAGSRALAAGLGGLLLLAAGAGASPADRARGMILAGDRVEARAHLDSVLAAEAPLPREERDEALLLRALLEEEGEAVEERLRAFLAEAGERPLAATAHLELGRLHLAAGRPADALEAFRHAREQGLAEEGSLWEGLAALVLGDGLNAGPALERAAASGNSRIRQRALLALGDLNRLRRDWEEARIWYRRLREDPVEGPGWWATATWRAAECAENLGDLQGARALLEELLRREPGAHEATLARSRLELWVEPLPVVGAGEEAEDTRDPVAAEGPRFAVQAGAFSLAGNAENRADEIRALGFAHVRIVTGEEGLHRVLVGAFAGRDAAEALADSLGTATRSSVGVVPLRGPGTP